MIKVEELKKYLKQYDPAAEVRFHVVNQDRGAATIYPLAGCTAIEGKCPCLYIAILEPNVLERETDMWNPKDILNE